MICLVTHEKNMWNSMLNWKLFPWPAFPSDVSMQKHTSHRLYTITHWFQLWDIITNSVKHVVFRKRHWKGILFFTSNILSSYVSPEVHLLLRHSSITFCQQCYKQITKRLFIGKAWHESEHHLLVTELMSNGEGQI